MINDNDKTLNQQATLFILRWVEAFTLRWAEAQTNAQNIFAFSIISQH